MYLLTRGLAHFDLDLLCSGLITSSSLLHPSIFLPPQAMMARLSVLFINQGVFLLILESSVPMLIHSFAIWNRGFVHLINVTLDICWISLYTLTTAAWSVPSEDIRIQQIKLFVKRALWDHFKT
jgi:hypothetical protein